MVSNHPGLPCARSHTPDVFATRGHTERHGRIRLLRRLAAPADAACSYLAGALQCRPDMLQRRIHGCRRVYRRMAMGRVACHCDVGNIPQLLGIMLETVAWAALGGALSAGIFAGVLRALGIVGYCSVVARSDPLSCLRGVRCGVCRADCRGDDTRIAAVPVFQGPIAV